MFKVCVCSINDAFDIVEYEKRKPSHCSVIKYHDALEPICHCLEKRERPQFMCTVDARHI